MVRNVPKYRDAAMIEIKILKDLRKHFDVHAPFVMLWDCFDFRNHVCMVFEPLGTSIYDFVSENQYQPFPPEMVRQMARQLVDGAKRPPLVSALLRRSAKAEAEAVTPLWRAISPLRGACSELSGCLGVRCADAARDAQAMPHRPQARGPILIRF